MNREEVFKTIHKVFTGKEDEKHSQISEYESLSPLDGLEKAEKYLDWAKTGQDNCKSDWSYWKYEGDVTLGTVMVGVFKALKNGITNFPEIPKLSPFLMDKTHQIQKWAEEIESELCPLCNSSKVYKYDEGPYLCLDCKRQFSEPILKSS